MPQSRKAQALAKRRIAAIGKSGGDNCTTTNQDGEGVALFRGHGRVIPGHHLEGTE